MDKTQFIVELKKIINRYFENDPWSMEQNAEYDEDYSAQDAIEDIVELVKYN